MIQQLDSRISVELGEGMVIPAHPLALTAERRLDERRQRALSRYYVAAGAGGLAVGVHTTQFAIRDPRIGLYRPVLELAAEEMDRADVTRAVPLVRIGGICGGTQQAIREARLLADLGYHAGLLTLTASTFADDAALIQHCRTIAEVIPIIGFYMQQSVGGCVLSSQFWNEFVEIENVAAIKIAPFDRYQTLDVMRAVCASKRAIPVYTGNDEQHRNGSSYTLRLFSGWRDQRNPHEGRPVGPLGGLDTVRGRTASRLQEGNNRYRICAERTAAKKCRGH